VTRVVVSVGTDHHRFDRMIEWIERARTELGLDVFVQHGATSGAGADPVESVDYVGADELATLMRDADAVVCHGGPGTISLARTSGHRPIVIARNPAFGEHVDDHQMRYVAKLAGEGIVDTAGSPEELIALLSAERPRLPVIADDDEQQRTVTEFATLVERLLAGTLPKRSWRERMQIRREA